MRSPHVPSHNGVCSSGHLLSHVPSTELLAPASMRSESQIQGAFTEELDASSIGPLLQILCSSITPSFSLFSQSQGSYLLPAVVDLCVTSVSLSCSHSCLIPISQFSVLNSIPFQKYLVCVCSIFIDLCDSQFSLCSVSFTRSIFFLHPRFLFVVILVLHIHSAQKKNVHSRSDQFYIHFVYQRSDFFFYIEKASNITYLQVHIINCLLAILAVISYELIICNMLHIELSFLTLISMLHHVFHLQTCLFPSLVPQQWQPGRFILQNF